MTGLKLKTMSDLRRRKYLRSKFQDGDCPNGDDFAAMIDSGINQKSDQMFAVDQKLGIGNLPGKGFRLWLARTVFTAIGV